MNKKELSEEDIKFRFIIHPFYNSRKSEQAQAKYNQHRVNLVTRKPTKKEEDIGNFCSVPRPAQEIMDRLKISNQSKNWQKYIIFLIELGFLNVRFLKSPMTQIKNIVAKK